MNQSNQQNQEVLKQVRQFEKAMNETEQDPRFASIVRKMMLDGSPKVKRVPKILYHGTSLGNVDSIRENGLYAHKLFGQIYFCESKEDVLMFIEKPCAIVEVDTNTLLKKRFRLNMDHNKAIYPCEVYTYYRDVPPESITNIERMED